jgi:hypothetical protein
MNPPDTIYLQIEPEDGYEITWSENRINEGDVEYVRVGILDNLVGFVDFFTDDGRAVIRVKFGEEDYLITLKEEMAGLEVGDCVRLANGKAEKVTAEKWTAEELETAVKEAKELKALITGVFNDEH